MRRPTRALLAVASGVLVWLAFPTVGLWPLGFVAWIPLLHAVRGAAPAEAGLLGWLAGATMHALGCAFLVRTFERSGGFGAGASVAAFVAFTAYQGLRVGVVTLLAAKAAARSWPADLTFALAFAGVEVAFPMILPWTFGATVHGVAPLVQVADIGGAPLVSMVLVAANVGLYAAFTGRRRGLLWLAAPVVAAGYGYVRLSAIDEEIMRAPSLDVGVVQPRLEPTSRDAPTAYLIGASADLARRGAELVVSSEAVLPGPFPEEDLDGALSATVATELGVGAVLGVTVRRTAWDEHQLFFNTALIVDDSGHVVARHDKHRLLAFGEYFPFAPSVLGALSPRSGVFTEGRIEPRFTTERVRPSLSICYEDALPDFVRSLVARERPNVLVNLTNDGWFEGSVEPRVHLEIARARAVEQRMFLVRATNAGVSAVIDPAGRTVAELPESERGTLLARVRLLDEGTVYLHLGDGPEWGALGAVLALGFLTKPGFLMTAKPARLRGRTLSPSMPS
jgi:apolipoprotein N-acyltransferase